MPDKLRELQRLFTIEATKYNVLPLDDRMAERLNAELAGRPTLIKGSSQILFKGMGRLNENCVLSVRGRSHSVTAEVVITKTDARGVLLNQGGVGGGWALYVKEGRLTYCYNYVGVQRTTIAPRQLLAPGEHQLRMEFKYDGGGLGKGGAVTVYVDGKEMGSGRVERTHMVSFSLDETTDVGIDTGSPVTPDYGGRDNAFTGEIKGIRIDVGADSHDHLVDPEHLLAIAMTRQ